MKTTDIRKSECYVSPEVEIIDISFRSVIMETSPNGEQGKECEEHDTSWDCTEE